MNIADIQRKLNQQMTQQQQQMASQQIAAYNLAHVYSRVHISGGRSGGGANAFLSMLKSEMDDLRKSMQTDLARQIFGGDADYWTWRIEAAVREILT